MVNTTWAISQDDDQNGAPGVLRYATSPKAALNNLY